MSLEKDRNPDESRQSEGGEQVGGNGQNWLEWVVFAVGLVLTLGTLGYLGYEAATTKDQPPDLVVTLGRPEPRSEGYAVPVVVENTGTRTAEEVQIMITLEQPGGQKEEATLMFAFLPQQSTRRGWATFSSNPSQRGTLNVSVVSYAMP